MYETIVILCLICKSCAQQHLNFHDINSTDVVPRIVGGTAARLGDVPYQVAFKVGRRNALIYYTFCGGALIGPNKVLSAAHCFDEKSWLDCNCDFGSAVKVRPYVLQKTIAVVGNLNNRYRKSDPQGEWVKLSSGIYPAYYNFPKQDIAVITTSTPFKITQYVKIIPIASRHIEYSMNCLASGYGRLSKVGQAKMDSPILYMASLRIVPTQFCNSLHRRNMINFICTTSNIPDTAQGDSGGPLVCMNTGDPNDKGQGILAGIAKLHSPILYMAMLPIVPTQYCNSLHRKNMRKFICTTSNVQDTSKGDSGGPLVCMNTGDPNDKGQGILAGIVSGHERGAGSFFTRVSSYTRFIQNDGLRNKICILCINLTLYVAFPSFLI